MENFVLNNLFEFWEYIGLKNGFYNTTKAYNYVNAGGNSWPNKIFRVNKNEDLIMKDLYSKIATNYLPNSVSISGENGAFRDMLSNNNFVYRSTVKGMYLNLNKVHKPEDNFNSITIVDSVEKANDFAEIASKSFGYEVKSRTISSLINNTSKLKLYLGKHDNKYVCCGILFLDSNGYSGLHMIGTLPEYRGNGLGKTMTSKLLKEAHKNRSEKAVLVASKAGEKIYSKIGFIAQGTLESYSV